MNSKNGEESEDADENSKYFSNDPRTPELVIISDESISSDESNSEVSDGKSSPFQAHYSDISEEYPESCDDEGEPSISNSTKSVTFPKLDLVLTKQEIAEDTPENSDNKEQLGLQRPSSTESATFQNVSSIQVKQEPMKETLEDCDNKEQLSQQPSSTESVTLQKLSSIEKQDPMEETLEDCDNKEQLSLQRPSSTKSVPNEPNSDGFVAIKPDPDEPKDELGNPHTVSSLGRTETNSLKIESSENGSAQDEKKQRLLLPKMDGSNTHTLSPPKPEKAGLLEKLLHVTATSERTEINGIPCNITAQSGTSTKTGDTSSIKLIITVPTAAQVTTPKDNVKLEVENVSSMSTSQSNSPQPTLSKRRRKPDKERRKFLKSLKIKPSDKYNIGVPELNTEEAFQKTVKHITHLKFLAKQAKQVKDENNQIALDLSYSAPVNQMISFNKMEYLETSRSVVNDVTSSVGVSRSLVHDTKHLPSQSHSSKASSCSHAKNSLPQKCENDTEKVPALDLSCNTETHHLNVNPKLSVPKVTLFVETSRSVINDVTTSVGISRSLVSDKIDGATNPPVVTIHSDSEEEPQNDTGVGKASEALNSNSGSSLNQAMPDKLIATNPTPDTTVENVRSPQNVFMTRNSDKINLDVSASNLNSVSPFNRERLGTQNSPHAAFDNNRHFIQNDITNYSLNEPNRTSNMTSLNLNCVAPLDLVVTDTAVIAPSATDTGNGKSKNFSENNLSSNDSTRRGSTIQQNYSLNDTSGMSPSHLNSLASVDLMMSGTTNVRHASKNTALENNRQYIQNDFIASNHLNSLVQRNARLNRTSAGLTSNFNPMSSVERMTPRPPSGTTLENGGPLNNFIINYSAQIGSAAQENSILNSTSETNTSNLNFVASLDLAIPPVSIASHLTRNIDLRNNDRHFSPNVLFAKSPVQECREQNSYRNATQKEYTNVNLNNTAALNSLSSAVMPPYSTNVTNYRFLPQSSQQYRESHLRNMLLAERFESPYSDLRKTASPANPLLSFAPTASQPPRYLYTSDHRMYPQNSEFSAFQQQMYQQQNWYPEDRASQNENGSAFHFPSTPAPMAVPLPSNSDIANREMYLHPCSSICGYNYQSNRLQGAAGAANINFEQNNQMLSPSEIFPPNNLSLVNQSHHQENCLPAFEADKKISRYGHSDAATAGNRRYATKTRAASKAGRQRKSPSEKAASSVTKTPVFRGQRRGRKRGRISDNLGESNTRKPYTSDEGNPQGDYTGMYQMPPGCMYTGNDRQVYPNNCNPMINYSTSNSPISMPGNHTNFTLNVPFNSSYLNPVNYQAGHPNVANAGRMNIADKCNRPNHHFNPHLMALIYKESCSSPFMSSRQFPSGAYLPANHMVQNHLQSPNMYRLNPQCVSNENTAHTLPSYQEAFGISCNRNPSECFNSDYLGNSAVANCENNNPGQKTMKPNEERSSEGQISEGIEKEFTEKYIRNASNSNLSELPKDLSTRYQATNSKRESLLHDHNSTTPNTDVLNSSNFEHDPAGETRAGVNMLDNSTLSEAISLNNESQIMLHHSNTSNKSSASDTDVSTEQKENMKRKFTERRRSIQNDSPNESDLSDRTDRESRTTNESNSTKNKSVDAESFPPKKKTRLDQVKDYNPCDKTLYAKRAFDEARYLEFFQFVSEHDFPVCDHKELRAMWEKAQTRHYVNTTGLPITETVRFKILKENPFPSTIQETCDTDVPVDILQK